MSAPDIRTISGLVATCCTSGAITPEFGDARSDLRSFNDRNELHKVEYRTFYAQLVEEGRDAAVRHMLDAAQGAYQWILQIDADAAPFPPNALARMLNTMFVDMPHIDALGGYCQLKGAPYLPTIDTGTGTWEEHYPGEGIIPVIRTGAHFLLCKRSAFARTGPPWFRTRLAQPPMRAMAEVDGFARQRLGGDNPLATHPEWHTLMQMAAKVSPKDTHVGEDSGFFDKLRATGGVAYVDTDLVVGHRATKVIMPGDFIDAMAEQRRVQAACIGVRL